MMSIATPVVRVGASAERARAAVVLLHGRGSSAADMIALASSFALPDIAYVAPEARGRSWYPYSFLAPLSANEPYLSEALATVDRSVGGLVAQGVPRERVVLLGFSQGGCLALEYAARNAGAYGGVVGLSAGLIGPPASVRNDSGSMAGTPVFLGCSDVDSHIPLARVHESAETFGKLGATVVERIYPSLGHTIVDDEIEYVRKLLQALPKRNPE